MSNHFRLHSFPRLLLGSLGLAVGLLLGSALVLRWSWTAQAKASNSVAHSYEIIAILKDIDATLNRSESGERGYVLTGIHELFDDYRASIRKVRILVGDLEEQTGEMPGQQDHLVELRAQMTLRLNVLDRIVRLRTENRHDEVQEAIMLGVGRPAAARIHDLLDQMENEERTRLVDRQAALEQVRRRQAHIALGLLAAEVTFAVFMIVLVRRVLALRRMVTVCAWSKQIKLDGRWLTLEQYLDEELHLRTTHGISPEMAQKLMANFEAQAESRPPRLDQPKKNGAPISQ